MLINLLIKKWIYYSLLINVDKILSSVTPIEFQFYVKLQLFEINRCLMWYSNLYIYIKMAIDISTLLSIIIWLRVKWAHIHWMYFAGSFRISLFIELGDRFVSSVSPVSKQILEILLSKGFIGVVIYCIKKCTQLKCSLNPCALDLAKYNIHAIPVTIWQF